MKKQPTEKRTVYKTYKNKKGEIKARDNGGFSLQCTDSNYDINALQVRVIEVMFHKQAEHDDPMPLEKLVKSRCDKDQATMALSVKLMQLLQTNETQFKCGSPYFLDLVYIVLEKNYAEMNTFLSEEEHDCYIDEVVKFCVQHNCRGEEQMRKDMDEKPPSVGNIKVFDMDLYYEKKRKRQRREAEAEEE